MPKSERILIVFMGLLSLGFATAAAMGFYQQRREQARAMQAQVLPVAPAEVIGPHLDFEGDPHSPYTLVEFGDYQCPPCHAANEKIPALLKKYRGKVRFTFRNLPLTSIHPYAMPAALVAEAAREQGKFWPMHDSLYQIQLNPQNLHGIMRKPYLDYARLQQACNTTANHTVQADMVEAKQLGLHGTPTFLLCLPNHSVILLASLSDVDNYI